MSSVQTAFAQNGNSRFVSVGAKLWTQAELEQSIVDGGSAVNYLGNVYLVDTAAHFVALLFDLSGSSSAVTTTSGETLLDMGKELHVGIAGDESNLLTFRRVQRTSGSVATGYPSGSPVGYVLIENKLSMDSTDHVNVNDLVKVRRV